MEQCKAARVELKEMLKMTTIASRREMVKGGGFDGCQPFTCLEPLKVS